MHPQSIKARSKPYLIRDRKSRICGYCGITQKAWTLAGDYYCRACTPLAESLGWIAPSTATYTCTRCGQTKRATTRGVGRDICGECRRNTTGRKARA